HGNLYVSDFEGARVFKISPTGRLTVVAGTGERGYSGDGGRAAAARLAQPTGGAVDGKGHAAITDYANNVVREVNAAGEIRTVLGKAPSRLRHPIGVAFQGKDLFVAD